MRMLLATAGSRGDVAPFVALARAAQARGHEPLLVAPRGSGVTLDGVPVHELDVDFGEVLRAQGASRLAAARSMTTVVRPAMREVLVGTARVARDFAPEAVVHHPKVLSAAAIAARFGASAVAAELVPSVTPTRAFPAAGTVRRSLGGALNRLTYRGAAAAARMFAAEMAEARELLGVERDAPPAGSLVPVSPRLLARPSDWPASTVLTGAWSVDRPGSVAPDVEDFIAAGGYVYAGLGSMVTADPLALGAAVVRAARERGLRVLLARGLGGVDLADDLRADDVLVVDAVEHARVLPAAVAAIHHGGVGTVHAAARAGVTSVVVPVAADQPFWGALLHRAGLSPAPVPPRAATADSLGAAIDAAGVYAARNRELGPLIAAERGADAALDRVEALAR